MGTRASRYALAVLSLVIALTCAGLREVRAETEFAFGGATGGSLVFYSEGQFVPVQTRRGSYRAEGDLINISVITGHNEVTSFNSFYVADISGLVPNLTDVRLVYTRTANRTGTPTITYGVFQGDAATLWNPPEFSPATFQGLQASPALAAVTVTEPYHLAVDLGPGFVAAVNTAISSGARYFAVGGTTGARGAGVGVPGPVAGAGLPLLVLAGAAWLLSTRKARRESLAG